MRESGYNGSLVSLGGVVGPPGIGRLSNYEYITFAGAVTAVSILPDNPKRIAAMLYVNGANPVVVYLSNNFVGMRFELQPGDAFFINELFPWTGAIIGIATLATNMRVNEVTIP